MGPGRPRPDPRLVRRGRHRGCPGDPDPGVLLRDPGGAAARPQPGQWRPARHPALGQGHGVPPCPHRRRRLAAQAQRGEEERRLFYVGMTRARETLTLGSLDRARGNPLAGRDRRGLAGPPAAPGRCPAAGGGGPTLPPADPRRPGPGLRRAPPARAPHSCTTRRPGCRRSPPGLRRGGAGPAPRRRWRPGRPPVQARVRRVVAETARGDRCQDSRHDPPPAGGRRPRLPGCSAVQKPGSFRWWRFRLATGVPRINSTPRPTPQGVGSRSTRRVASAFRSVVSGLSVGRVRRCRGRQDRGCSDRRDAGRQRGSRR